jgi:hypothetical protein
MKFRPAVLLGGAVLIAALPVWADSIFYTAATHDSPTAENSAKAIRSSGTKRKTPATAVFTSEPLSAVPPGWADAMPSAGIGEDSTYRAIAARDLGSFALGIDEPQDDVRQSEPTSELSIGGFQSGGAFGVRGPEPSFVLGTLLSSSSASSVHSNSLGEPDSNERASTFFNDGKERRGIGHDHDKGDKGKKQDQDGPGSVSVPEPAAFSLVLLGLAAIGIMARRSREFPPTA